jgi:hypothetical protein
MRLIDLLAAKHAKDVFVPECKDGPTHYGNHVRLDAWALASSWAHPCVYGYEIKVSRGDFLQDNKWPAYLPLCNQLYFVCPTGLIQPTEVSPDVGLMWASKTGTKLYTKKKAPYRDVAIPEDVYRYVLMCRAKITREPLHLETARDFWERWLEDRDADKEFGSHVGGRIREHYLKRVLDVEAENQRLLKLMHGYDDVRRMLTRLGMNTESVWSFTVERKIEEARTAVPTKLLTDLERAERALADARKSLEAFKQPDELLAKAG